MQKTTLRRLVHRSRRRRRQKLIRCLDDWLTAAQSSPRSWVRRLCIRPLFELRRLARLFLDGLHLKIILLKGHAMDSQVPFTVAYIGVGGASLAFLQQSLFAEGQIEREQRGQCLIWQGPARASMLAGEADMVILERNNVFSWKPPFGEWRVGPPWVRMVRDFGPDEDWQQVKHSMRRQRENIRHVRRGGYTYRFTHDKADFDHFYHHMHVPFVTARYKSQTIISNQAHLRSFFQQGALMLALRQGEQPVAAWICMSRGNVLYLGSLGVLEGELHWMRDGAVSALYYYALQWAHEQGMRRVDGGRCRPFLTDGPLNHKERWGLRPEPDLWVHDEWLFWVPDDSPAAQAWFQAHPFVSLVSQSGGKAPNCASESVPDLTRK